VCKGRDIPAFLVVGGAVTTEVYDCARGEPDERGVLVGLSGGVDSAVAALLLREQGYRVSAVTLRLWSDPGSSDRRTGRSVQDVARAAQVAERLDIAHAVVDAGDVFSSGVVSYFVDQYAQGRTPNPCVKCNARIRFGLLLEIARKSGLSRIATGHYARLIGSPGALARAVDRGKDQSYVLAEVLPGLLSHCLFPLGSLTKAVVRRLAAGAGLENEVAAESQEICFISDDDHRRFLRQRLGELPGAIVDLSGRQLGRHSGTYNFTIGQRKGLGISADRPLYVVALSAERREVVVGPPEGTAAGGVVLEDVVCHRPQPSRSLLMQWRSTGGSVRARVSGSTAEGGGQVQVDTLPPAVGDEPASARHEAVAVILEEPAMGVSPGQTAVLYDRDLVVMAGTIRSTRPWSETMREGCVKG